MKINVLSLFDGIACGYVALQRAGIEVNKYYASEIDKYAIKVAGKNYPDIIELGDVENWKKWNIELGKIDLLIGGSPCQGFSSAGLHKNFNDNKSKLFWNYLDILNHLKKVNPNIKFLLENVKMKKEYADIISEKLRVKFIEINSALVSAQNRKRYYWTNISDDIKQPEDKHILLKDILLDNSFADREKSLCLTEGYNKRAYLRQYFTKHPNQIVMHDYEKYIIPDNNNLTLLEKDIGHGLLGYYGKSNSQGSRVYLAKKWKAVTLCGNGGGGGAKMGLYYFGDNPVDIAHVDGYIRKLTPIECERLQTLPDNYTESVSDNQRYRQCGNGWTVDVIAHILKYLKEAK
jgi:DNA-cytosine methyltransferase